MQERETIKLKVDEAVLVPHEGSAPVLVVCRRAGGSLRLSTAQLAEAVADQPIVLEDTERVILGSWGCEVVIDES